jgi:hypothetical protein
MESFTEIIKKEKIFDFNKKTAIISVAVAVLFWVVVPVLIDLRQKEVEVTILERHYVSYASILKRDKYVFITTNEDGKINIYEIEESFRRNRYDGFRMYARIKIGCKYRLKVVGFRIPFLDSHPKIINSTLLEEPPYLGY